MDIFWDLRNSYNHLSLKRNFIVRGTNWRIYWKLKEFTFIWIYYFEEMNIEQKNLMKETLLTKWQIEEFDFSWFTLIHLLHK
jgi:hypothetical protein